MEEKYSKGEWKTLDKAVFNPYQNVWSKALYVNNLTFCMYILGRTEAESESNAKLIAAAPNMLDALLETDKDLCVLESTMAQIESTDPRAEGMTELVKKWRERNKLAIKKATE